MEDNEQTQNNELPSVIPDGISQDSLTVQQRHFLSLYVKYGFNITKICAEMGITRQTYYRWTHDVPEFKTLLVNYDEALLDYSKEALINHIKDGNLVAAMFIMKHLDKRFHNQEHRIDVNTGGQPVTNLTFNIVHNKSEDAKTD